MNYPGKALKIRASGKYLPEKISSADLEIENPLLPEGYSERNSGVYFRHRASFESNGYMGARAAESALEKAGISLSDIDLLISAAATFDYPLPSCSSVIKSEMAGTEQANFPTLDIDSTCLSFVSAFEVAAKMLDGKQYRNILIVSSEIASKGLNRNDPETFTLFGDAAVAFILTMEDGPSCFAGAWFRTYSEGLACTMIRGGGNKHHFRDTPYDESLFSFEMKGIQMLKLAQRTLPEFMEMVLKELSMELNDFDAILPHQASKTGLQLFQRLFRPDEGKLKTNLDRYGNCIAASIPLLLHDCIENGEIKRGHFCLLFGTSAGFSIGALAFRY
jgi:3-oxoacyl-[acyl-carrier-protein] synthase-3